MLKLFQLPSSQKNSTVPAAAEATAMTMAAPPAVTAKKKAGGWSDFFSPPTIPKNKRIEFFDQLATLLESGVPIVESLEVLLNQTQLQGTKKLIAYLIRNIREGKALSACMEEFPRVFPAMVTHLLAIGEQSGMLPELVRAVATKMEEQHDLKRKIRGAMIYPIIVISLSILLIVGMLVFAVPRLEKMYASAHVSLPAATQTILSLSQFLSNYYLVALIGLVVLILALTALNQRVPSVKKMFEQLLFHLPIVGSLAKDNQIALFASNLGLLMKSGMLIDAAFQLLQNTTFSLLYREHLAEIREGLLQGKNVSSMMGLDATAGTMTRTNALFPMEVAQIIRVGEQTGNMVNVLNKIGENKMKRINYFVKNMSSIIEPLLIVLVGTIIAAIIIPLMLPIFNIGSTIG